jgi:hypothetical protein
MVHIKDREHNGTLFNIIISDNVFNFHEPEFLEVQPYPKLDLEISIKYRQGLLTKYINCLMAILSGHAFDCFIYVEREVKKMVEYYTAYITENCNEIFPVMKFYFSIVGRKLYLYYTDSFIEESTLVNEAEKMNIEVGCFSKTKHIDRFPEHVFYSF